MTSLKHSENPHILKAAVRMMDRYGNDALNQVDGRIEELSQIGNDNGDSCKLWRQVRQMIVTLLEDANGNLKH